MFSAMPITIAVANATDRLENRAISAAASARTSTLGPSVSIANDARSGASRIAVDAASTPAITHTIADMRFAEIPASRAASGFSAAARMACP
jgi:hypothetical protein